jgi:hypothetical protein
MRHEYLAIQSLAQSQEFNSVNFTYQPCKEYESDQILNIFTDFGVRKSRNNRNIFKSQT